MLAMKAPRPVTVGVATQDDVITSQSNLPHEVDASGINSQTDVDSSLDFVRALTLPNDAGVSDDIRHLYCDMECLTIIMIMNEL